MNSVFIKKGVTAFVLLFCTLTANAQLKKLVFCPQWHANIQFAGYIIARELGYYEKEGLSVTIRYPEGAKSSLELLRDGEVDLAMGILMNALMAKANGEIDLVNVMQTSQHAALCLALKKPLEEISIDKLSGMRVGLWSFHTAISASILNKLYNLNWDVVPFRNGIKLLSYGVMDAISVMEYNELLRLKYTGRDVSAHSVFKMCEHGYDIPEDGVYCLSDYYKQHANEVQAFIRASKKGWEWCRQHPKETVEMVTKEMNKQYVNNSKVFQNAGLKVVLKKQELTPGNVNFKLLPEKYDYAAGLLREAGLISIVPDFETFIAR